MAERKAYRLQMSPDLYRAVQDAAYNERISMNEFIAGALAAATGHAENPAVVGSIKLGWVKVARWGELPDRDDEGEPHVECPECGGEMRKDAAYIGLLSNGQHTQPVCAGCATSE